MTVKTRDQLKTENAADFPNNTTRLISPADLRGQMDDIVDSMFLAEDIDQPGGPVGWPLPIDGDGEDLHGVDGVAALRLTGVTAGQTVRLNYHTTPGDYGSGLFYGVTTGGPYTDNDGTIFVAGGGTETSAWLRIWDHVKAHVGWFGAKCDPHNLATDDYIPVKKCFDLFTSGRASGGTYGGGTITTGIIDVGPGFNFSQPLIYGGSVGGSFRLVGTQSNGRGGQEKSLLRYTGPATHASIIFYGANEWSIEDINNIPGLALNGFLITADNSYNNFYTHTTTADITAGSNVVVTPAGGPAIADRILWLQPGVFLGVGGQSMVGGAAAGADFEIVYITAVDTVAGTFTADFTKNHASGSLLGGGAPCSSGWVNRCRIMTPPSPIWTKLTAATAGGTVTFVVEDITGIKVGHPVRVGSLAYAEIVYPTTVNVGAKSFTAASSFSHAIGELVMYPTGGITVGNLLIGTVQVDNITFNDTFFVGAELTTHPGTSVTTSNCYAGFRQMWGGNVKAFMFNNTFPQYLRCAFACDQASGQYMFNGGSSAKIDECLWWNIASTLMVQGWEDESSAMWLTGGGGTSPSQATFIGCTMQGQAPDVSIVGASDEMFIFAGQLTFIGCVIQNGRIYSDGVSVGTLPLISSTGILNEALGIFPSGIALFNSTIIGATSTNRNFIRQQPGDTADVIKDGSGNLTMLNCIGSVPGANYRLPNILPPLKAWQGIAIGIDPPSLAAGTVGSIGTISVSGAALGDLVEASFSNDLQGIALRAWVSAADTVSYQFANPTAAPIDLASGTVKVRVKK